jgi:DNA-directed RNA polymerase specialized sigma24 family protein
MCAPDDQGPEGFQQLMAGVRQGDSRAVRRLIDDFGADVAQFVRRYRTSRLRSKFDPEDYVQEVWKSFFRRAHRLHFDNARALLGFLSRLAHNEVMETILHFLHTLKNDVGREVSLEGCALDSHLLESPEPAPWTRLACQDEIDEVLRRTSHHLGHEIIRHLGEGYSQRDAARILGVSEKTVGRVMAQIRLEALKGS